MKDSNSTDSDPLRKPKRAIALHYKEADELPKVVASGVDELARRIIELAEAHNIPIQQDEMLAEMLGKIGTGNPISPQSYRLVAEIISFLYHTDKEWRAQHAGLGNLLDAPQEKLTFAEGGPQKALSEEAVEPALLEKRVDKR